MTDRRRCCVQPQSLVATWTREAEEEASYFDKTCVMLEDLEVKENEVYGDWKPVCLQHAVIMQNHKRDFTSLKFRPVPSPYVIQEDEDLQDKLRNLLSKN